VTAVGIDVGGRRKGFHGCALRGDEREPARAACGIRWTPERSRLAGNPYYEWSSTGSSSTTRSLSANTLAAALVARLHAEGETRAFGEIIVPVGPL